MNVYIFFRDKLWYPIELRDDKDAIANALNNPGTTKVETPSGEIVWQPEAKVLNLNHLN